MGTLALGREGLGGEGPVGSMRFCSAVTSGEQALSLSPGAWPRAVVLH